jgi:hypothetical protein
MSAKKEKIFKFFAEREKRKKKDKKIRLGLGQLPPAEYNQV